MSLRIFENKGYPLDKQLLTWKEMVNEPVSKLNDDAFTRVRVILMSAIELEAVGFSHACARMNKSLQHRLAKIRRVDLQQATTINWLLGADHSPLEITIAGEQAAIEIAAAVARVEPNPYLAQVYRFGMLEDFDHIYRFSALMDRLEGKDANNILQSYTDILPGRPTIEEHRAPADDLREPYDRVTADPLSKINALTIMAITQRTWNYYLTIGPMFSDPLARQLYVEIASIEEQHLTQYESIIDSGETWLEKWLLRKANEVYNYYSCVQTETNSKVKAVWERFLDFELGQFHSVAEIFGEVEGRDPREIIPPVLPEPRAFDSQRQFIRETLHREVDLRTRGGEFVARENESLASQIRRARLHVDGVPSEIVARGYIWVPGGEMNKARFIGQGA